MSTLKEIESAARVLPAGERRELLVYVAETLREQGIPLPSPRRFSAAEMKVWMDEDERALREFQGGV
jgi:hypothetical protein